MASNPSLVRSVGRITSPLKRARMYPWGMSKRPNSSLESAFELGIMALKFPAWERDFMFHETRKWELDFAWPNILFAVEVDGGVHRIKKAFHASFEKHAKALMLGWTILRVDGPSIKSGEAFQWAESLMWERRGL